MKIDDDLFRIQYLNEWSSWNPPQENDTAELLASLHARRYDLRLTQVDLAYLAGVSPRFVHDLERGKPTVQFDKVLAVASTLQLKLEWQYPAPRRFNVER